MLRSLVLMLFLSLFLVFVSQAQETYLPTVVDSVIDGNEPELVGKIIITIDDCALQDQAEIMFSLLESRGLKATWFCNTRYLKDAGFWRQVYDAGHEFGYHTTNHTSPSIMTGEQLAADFAAYETSLRELLGDESLEIKLVRPPFGDWNETWMTWAASHDLYTVRWNLVIPNRQVTQEYIRAVISHPNGGSIFLMHTRSGDAAWLDANLEFLVSLVGEGNSLTFPTLSQAFLGDNSRL